MDRMVSKDMDFLMVATGGGELELARVASRVIPDQLFGRSWMQRTRGNIAHQSQGPATGAYARGSAHSPANNA